MIQGTSTLTKVAAPVTGAFGVGAEASEKAPVGAGVAGTKVVGVPAITETTAVDFDASLRKLFS